MELTETPWYKSGEVVIDTRHFIVYKDKYPVTEGHVLIVPKTRDWPGLEKAYKAAYQWGYDWVERGYCDAFNIGQNCGEAAGQTIDYPHIHLIPRRKSDMKDPTGGVRHAIPEKGNYKKHEPDPQQMRLFE
jgi:diadenosine tetraphosphate (Ap4A) HIT family hydrolase|tara:strand:- start:1277 stop:1669 length:393 start_codon:yes stop_codon:yes gene_type:complete